MKKIIRTVTTATIAIIMSASLLTNAYAANVRIDGILTNFSNRPVNLNGYVMIDVEEIFEEISISTHLAGETIVAQGRVQNRDFHLDAKVGSQEALVNGVKVELTAPIIRQDNRLIMPIRTLNDLLGMQISWDGNTSTVLVNTGNNDLSVLNLRRDIDNTTLILSYEEALERALANNTSLKDLIGGIEVMRDQKDQLDENLDNARANSSPFNSALASLLSALREVETTLDNVELTKAQIRDATDVTLKNILSTLNGYKLDMALLENNIKLQELNVRNIELKLSLGMESDYNLKTAQSNLEQSQLNLSTLSTAMHSQNLSLNNYLGLSPETKVHINFVTEMNPLAIDLQAHINDKLKTDPTIITRQRAVDNARFSREQYNEFSRHTVNPLTGEIISTDTSDVRLNNDIATAQRAFDDAKRNIENAIRQSYNQLIQLQQRASTLELDLAKAKETYNTVVVNYMAGMITNYEVEQAKLGILNAEIAIMKNIDSYNLAMIIFENPYMGL